MSEPNTERAMELIDRLDNATVGLVNMTTLDPNIHVQALRGILPEIVSEMKAALDPDGEVWPQEDAS